MSVQSAAWRKSPLTAGVCVNDVSKQELIKNETATEATSLGEAGCRAALKGADLPCEVASDVRTDLNFAYTGFNNLRLLANINNVFDQLRPINVRDGYAMRPRTLKLGAEYTF